MITVFFCSITYQLTSLILYLAYHLYRWFDRGFTKDKRKTRQLIQIDYNNIHKGPMIPIDNSYSNLWTLIFIILMFCAGLPSLYLFGAGCFFLLYWVDKYLSKDYFLFKRIALRFYCNPPRLDEKFAKKTQNLIPYAIMFHLAITILIYGSI
jgi:hypothetical protein